MDLVAWNTWDVKQKKVTSSTRDHATPSKQYEHGNHINGTKNMTRMNMMQENKKNKTKHKQIGHGNNHSFTEKVVKSHALHLGCYRD